MAAVGAGSWALPLEEAAEVPAESDAQAATKRLASRALRQGEGARGIEGMSRRGGNRRERSRHFLGLLAPLTPWIARESADLHPFL
ncbi:MAG: hypothetical protein ACJA2W_001383 [Planctomycetota bacterium]|jgi:hypothetical protein